MRVTYSGQGYLSGQNLQSDFTVSILPRPVSEAFGSGALSLFELDGVTTSFDLEVGEAWSFVIPDHEEAYEGVTLAMDVDLGTAETFATYNEGTYTLAIAADATTPSNKGQNSMNVNLKTPDGQIVSYFTVRINVLYDDGGSANAAGSDGASASDEEALEDELEAIEGSGKAQNVGDFYGNLLSKRKGKINDLALEAGELTVPTAKLVGVT